MNHLEIIPTDDKILIEPIKRGDEKTAGGIVIPSTAINPQQEPLARGKVLAIGPGQRMIALDGVCRSYPIKHIAVGDEILYPRFQGQKLDLPNNAGERAFVREADVWAVVRPVEHKQEDPTLDMFREALKA